MQVREKKERKERMKTDQEIRKKWKREEEICVNIQKERAEGEAKKARKAEGVCKA